MILIDRKAKHNIKNYEIISLPVKDGLIMVNITKIIYCESDGGYTNLHMGAKETLMISRSLNEFQDILDTLGFVRIHKSYLINLRHLKKYTRGEGGSVKLTSGISLNVGRAYKRGFLETIVHFI